MNKKEVSEIRRRFRRERCNMTAIYGCYVRDNQEIISEFKVSMGMLPENEADKYMSLFKKTLGGSLGKNLNNISFSTRQVVNREASYAMLSDLRSTALNDDAKREAFYKSVIASLHLDHNYLILLGCESYDVPFKTKDDETQALASDESFTYIVCSICPVKETKPNLHYVHAEATFHDGGMTQAVNAPILGFLFPAFDDRSTNLYGALYFSKSTSDCHSDFVEAVFGTAPLRPADAEKGLFSGILASTLGEECSIEVVQAIHEQANDRLQLHEEAKVPEPLTVRKNDIQSVLTGSGVSDTAVKAFGKAFDENFGHGAEVNLQNIVDVKHYTVVAPDVVIKVAPERAQDVEIRTLGGVEYIMIPTNGEVLVNDVPVISHSTDK